MQYWCPKMNRGAQRLKERLSGRGDKKKLADLLEVDPPLVSHWLSGDRKPTTKQRAQLEDEYGIGWRTWDEEVRSNKGAA